MEYIDKRATSLNRQTPPVDEPCWGGGYSPIITTGKGGGINNIIIVSGVYSLIPRPPLFFLRFAFSHKLKNTQKKKKKKRVKPGNEAILGVEMPKSFPSRGQGSIACFECVKVKGG